MKRKLSITLILLIICAGCRSQLPKQKSTKLPSGKEINVTSIIRMDFPNSEPGLVMSYLTDISIDDKVALRKEVDEIWSLFKKDVEDAGLRTGIIRATHMEGTFVKSGKGYGFVFQKRDDGKWHCLEDNK